MSTRLPLIFWHFTGSPSGVLWDVANNPEEILDFGPPKPPDVAVDTLMKILDSKTVRAGQAHLGGHIRQEKFCCVGALPIEKLPEHARYYGKVGIGFSADALRNKGFTQAYYMSEDETLNLTWNDLSEPEDREIDSDISFDERASVFHLIACLFQPSMKKSLKDKMPTLGTTKDHIKLAEDAEDERLTFRREREWRHFGNFHFEPADVIVVTAPQQYESVLKQYLYNNGYGHVTFWAWEDVGGVYSGT